jgi:glyoxylase-like metal-dependent hydrolase (beta-lactamase superfamily II)
MNGRWIEIAEGVLVRRYAELDQTLGLVVGAEHCLVVDTGRDEVHGAEMAAAVREVTPLEWTALITHSHWDHFFGTASFLPCAVWAHDRCRSVLADSAEDMRARGLRYYAAAGRPDLAAHLETARTILPTDVLTGDVTVNLGGRTVVLIHPGRGHTGNDVVAHVPDAGVVFAGDLVEQGAPPVIGDDAYPLEWPATLDAVLALQPAVVVPGHGEPVDHAYARRQRDQLSIVSELVRAVAAGQISVDDAVGRSPYPEDATMPALRRAQPATP